MPPSSLLLVGLALGLAAGLMWHQHGIAARRVISLAAIVALSMLTTLGFQDGAPWYVTLTGVLGVVMAIDLFRRSKPTPAESSST